jgi:hypothetical protein
MKKDYNNSNNKISFLLLIQVTVSFVEVDFENLHM